jgi:hypothetical protein
MARNQWLARGVAREINAGESPTMASALILSMGPEALSTSLAVIAAAGMVYVGKGLMAD